MKNREKFAKEILDIACEGQNIGINRFTNKPHSCNSLECQFCKIKGNCEVGLKEWSESEYIEKPTITSNEKTLLDLIYQKYKYIARDGVSNKLFLYIDKPSKHSTYWLSESKDLVYELLYKPLDIKFDFIKWEDEEPWSVEELKKLEVKNE